MIYEWLCVFVFKRGGDLFYCLIYNSVRLYWTDVRLQMPAVWDAIPKSLQDAGIDVSQALGITTEDGSANPQMWFPDVYFPDALSMDVTSQLVRLHPGGSMEWSRHVSVTMLEPEFSYENYPNDVQDIILRFQSYGLSTDYTLIAFKNPPVVLFKTYTGGFSFTMNPIWNYLGFSAAVEIEDNGTPGYPRLRSVGVIHILVQRQPDGLVLRLAMPVLLLAMIAALAFWAEVQDRLNIAITILLAVSALYIVVFGNIPMIGYLTVRTLILRRQSRSYILYDHHLHKTPVIHVALASCWSCIYTPVFCMFCSTGKISKLRFP
jgi:hypothetical protein